MALDVLQRYGGTGTIQKGINAFTRRPKTHLQHLDSVGETCRFHEATQLHQKLNNCLQKDLNVRTALATLMNQATTSPPKYISVTSFDEPTNAGHWLNQSACLRPKTTFGAARCLKRTEVGTQSMRPDACLCQSLAGSATQQP